MYNCGHGEMFRNELFYTTINRTLIFKRFDSSYTFCFTFSSRIKNTYLYAENDYKKEEYIMPKWIESFKKIYNTIKSVSDRYYMITVLQDKCYEKGYSLDETKKVIEYVKS